MLLFYLTVNFVVATESVTSKSCFQLFIDTLDVSITQCSALNVL